MLRPIKSRIVVATALVPLLFLLHSCGGAENIPIATILTDQTRYLRGYPIEFSADLKSGENSSDYEFSFDFGDTLSSQGSRVTHSYQAAGDYTVTLTITGASGVETDEITIKVLNSLELVASHSLRVDSPSGLSFGQDNNSLWTVSDKPGGRVVQIDLEGHTLRSLNYSGDDLEGISFDSSDSTLWMVDESQGKLIHIDTSGDIIGSQNISSVSDGSGLEGLAIDREHSRKFLLKEKDSGALITLDDLSLTQDYIRLTFAPDYSGVYYSSSLDKLWIVSHESSSIYLVNTSGEFLETYAVYMTQPEGIVFDETRQIFYLVDDTTERLHIYKFWD